MTEFQTKKDAMFCERGMNKEFPFVNKKKNITRYVIDEENKVSRVNKGKVGNKKKFLR